MWYRLAIKYNQFGLPISGGRRIKEFAGEDDTAIDENQVEVIEPVEPEDDLIEDPTPQDEITSEDVETNIEILETDPTANIKLPPLHNNCHCYIETLPILSQLNVNDGRRVWQKAENCCPVCEQSAYTFNQAEITRLLNSGIDVNAITR